MDKRRFNKLKRKYKLGEAGKGDSPRPVDNELYTLGQNILFAETEEEKQYWTREWEKAHANRNKKHG